MKTIIRLSILFVLILSTFFVHGQDLDTRQAPLPCVDKTFSIVAHITLDSFGNANITEENITDAITAANDAFAPICVRFEVCEFRTIPNFQYDNLERETTEWQEMQVKYHQARRINMFFVGGIGSAQSYVCGFAAVGGIRNLTSNGIVIQKGNCIEPGSTTIIHELGHYFSLLHTFEGEREELVDGSNCATAGDMICDTPADPFLVGDSLNLYVNPNLGCRFELQLRDQNNDWYAPHVGNYMSYYQSVCACGFTYGQYLQMANTFLNAPEKMW